MGERGPRLESLLAFGNGASSLALQVLWLRMLSDVLGAGAPGIGVLLAAWMGGQAAGAWWASRSSLPAGRAYARAEGFAAAWSLALPFALSVLPGGGLLLRAGWAFLLLLPPTFALGMTFPLLCRMEGASVRRIYGFGLLGSVAGAALGAWVLLPLAGLRVGVVAVSAAKLLLAAAGRGRSGGPLPGARAAGGAGWLLLALVLGWAGLGAEVVWTRMLQLLFAGSATALALVLVVLFLGSALGALASGSLERLCGGAGPFLGLSALLFGAVLLYCGGSYGEVLQASAGSLDVWDRAFRGVFLRGAALQAAAMILPPAFLLGAAFPVLAREAGASGAYAANTLGGLAGALSAAFVLVPGLGSFQRDLLVLGAVPAAVGAALLLRAAPWAVRGAALAGLLLGVAPAREALSGRPDGLSKAILGGVHHRVRWSDGRVQEVRHEEVFEAEAYEEGSFCTAAVLKDRRTGDRHLLVDNFFVAGTGPEYAYMRVEGHLPALLAPQGGNALLVGLGTGGTLQALALHPFEGIDVAEISPEVSRAARLLGAAALDGDPRVALHLDDARAFLRGTARSYRVITCEPPIPYLSGGTALFTSEFYAACRDRLAPGGVFCQWLPQTLYEEDARLLVRTLAAAFPEVTLWFARNSVLLLASEAPHRTSCAALASRLDALPAVREDLERVGMGHPAALLSLRWCGREGIGALAGEGGLLASDRPFLEYPPARGPILPSMAAFWDRLAPLREAAPAEEGPVARAWMRRYGDLQTLAFAWNRARLEPFLERQVRTERIAREAALLLPEGATAWGYFEGRERPTSP